MIRRRVEELEEYRGNGLVQSLIYLQSHSPAGLEGVRNEKSFSVSQGTSGRGRSCLSAGDHILVHSEFLVYICI